LSLLLFYKIFKGPGGCGKTFLYNTLIYKMRQEKKRVFACASTGIAALLLSQGATAHRTFGIPNDVDSTTTPLIKYESEYGKKLRESELIVIDEVSMIHQDVLNFIDKTLQDLQPKDEEKLAFGGKIVVLGGDWKQLLPVIEGASIHEQAANSVKASKIFQYFKTLKLRKNMRADADQKDVIITMTIKLFN